MKVEKYVIVDFRLDMENSVYYKKVNGIDELKEAIVEAYMKARADFVSVRRIHQLLW